MRRAIAIPLLLTVAVISGCTFSSGDNATAHLSIAMRETDPNLADFDCYFVNISGANISPTISPSGIDSQCLGLGIVSSVFKAEDHVKVPITLKAPSGPARNVQVIGVKSQVTEDDACKGITSPADLFKTPLPGLYVVSTQTTDLYKDSRIDLRNQYDKEKSPNLVPTCLKGSPASPAITLVSPTFGPVAGGTVVTIEGTNFSEPLAVTFGGVACGGVERIGDTKLKCTAAVSPSGTVDVVVTNGAGATATLANGFTYNGVLTLSSVSPNGGNPSGNNRVTFNGDGFLPGVIAKLGSAVCTSTVIVSQRELNCLAPVGAVSTTVDASVQNVGDASPVTLGGAYTYSNPPNVTQIDKPFGPLIGGQVVTITGSNFIGPVKVTLGDSPCINPANTATTITCTTTAHAEGKVHVYVANADTQSTGLLNGYEYVKAPTIALLTPSFGTAAGGTNVVITGTGFRDGISVDFGGSPCTTSFTVTSSTSLTCSTTTHSTGAATVTVTNQDGQTGTGLTFTYASGAFISSVAVSPAQPTVGQVHDLTINGSFVTPVAVALRGSTSCIVNVGSSNTNVTVCQGPGSLSAGWVDVTVTNNGGGSYTYPYAYRIDGGDKWLAATQSSAPTPRAYHSATRLTNDRYSKVAIWGGFAAAYLADGAVYDLNQDAWTPLTAAGTPPTGRRDHTAVWAENQMIVWGGYDINGPTNTGSSFDPLTNNWTALPITKAPSARGQHTALWTGTEMVIYGGFQSGGIEYNVEASRYVPSTGWDDQMQQPVTFPGRIYHSMVYDATTTRVIVFGGQNGASVFDTGKLFNPRATPNGQWSDLDPLNGPGARFSHSMVQMGDTTIVYGGSSAITPLAAQSGGGLIRGGAWLTPSISSTPGARFNHATAALGNLMYMWGGQSDGSTYLNDTWSYDYNAGPGGTWLAKMGANAPFGRYGHTLFPTTQELFVFGGVDPAGPATTRDGSRYVP